MRRPVWATCVDAVSALPGNPLQAVIEHVGALSLVALCAVDRGDINRVVGLGVGTPSRLEDLEAICTFYEVYGQRNFRIEVTPVAQPSELADWVADRGLACDGLGTFKMWRRTENPPAVTGEIEVRKLGAADTDAVTAINVAAWGAWSMPVSMAAWFGATVGRAGVQHYGAFDDGRLVATGALVRGRRRRLARFRCHPSPLPGSEAPSGHFDGPADRRRRDRAARSSMSRARCRPVPGPWPTAGSCSTRSRTSPRPAAADTVTAAGSPARSRPRLLSDPPGHA